jgi:hypothetical protein
VNAESAQSEKNWVQMLICKEKQRKFVKSRIHYLDTEGVNYFFNGIDGVLGRRWKEVWSEVNEREGREDPPKVTHAFNQKIVNTNTGIYATTLRRTVI